MNEEERAILLAALQRAVRKRDLEARFGPRFKLGFPSQYPTGNERIRQSRIAARRAALARRFQGEVIQ